MSARASPREGSLRGLLAVFNPGQWCVIVGIAIDHKERTRRDEFHHPWPVELAINSGRHAVIKRLHEIRARVRHACSPRRRVETALEGSHPSTPGIVFQAP